MEQIKLVYIDDDPEEAISAYLEEGYRNDKCVIEYQEIKFACEEGYESLLESQDVTSANIILIDSHLFENDNVKLKGKFSGEEFKVILRKVCPFIEVLVITQNEENDDYGIIPKYRNENTEEAEDYYKRILKTEIDEGIDRVITFRNITRKLQNNNGIEKVLLEKITQSLAGMSTYDTLNKVDY